MPPTPKSSEAAPTEPLYPAIESFIERASAEQVQELFTPIRQGLAGLKGPKAEHAKKVQKAIAAAEELLSHLLQVRERLEAERQGQK
ncbi:MAG: hypothetical protein ACOZIN_09195 [Myxococcota bacterium]